MVFFLVQFLMYQKIFVIVLTHGLNCNNLFATYTVPIKKFIPYRWQILVTQKQWSFTILEIILLCIMFIKHSYLCSFEIEKRPNNGTWLLKNIKKWNIYIFSKNHSPLPPVFENAHHDGKDPKPPLSFCQTH